jgi:hypothetical protein
MRSVDWRSPGPFRQEELDDRFHQLVDETPDSRAGNGFAPQIHVFI